MSEKLTSSVFVTVKIKLIQRQLHKHPFPYTKLKLGNVGSGLNKILNFGFATFNHARKVTLIKGTVPVRLSLVEVE